MSPPDPGVPKLVLTETNRISAHRTLLTRPQDYYIGIDVGTGSARACIIDATGEIKALASQNIKLWQPAAGYGGTHFAHYACLPSLH